MNVYVIPHGVDIPDRVYPMPKKFVVGYMGSYAADKGVRYLLEAWKRLNWKDAELVLAGRDSRTAWVTDGLIGRFGGGNIRLMGWVDNISDFYREIQVYVQPSVTEGFGCEVLEAMAAGRHVICSTGAGAADVVDDAWIFRACDVDDLMEKLTLAREADCSRQVIHENHYIAKNYTWDKIRQLYVNLWRSLIG
jgi:glycosyltransferase involved in cell wall biosynthesis